MPELDDLSLDEILGGIPEEEIHTDYIRLQSSMVGVVDVPVDPAHTTENGLPGYTLAEVLRMGNLTWNSATQFMMGETQIGMDAVIPNRATVTAIGLLKGGA
jgi:hypothetical protein